MMNPFYQSPAEIANFAKPQPEPETKALLNQAVADLSVAHSILHQVHWYMRGRGFLVWHPKMDDYMEELDSYLDEMSERLITLGGAPFSTLKEFSDNSQLKEVPGDYSLSMEAQLGRVVEVFRYLVGLFQKGLDVTDTEGDDVTNDIFNGAKASLEKHIWMLQAELGQAPGL
ncbi:DNA starvation/stationary phase protection protein [Streptococcus sp. zg-86]|uniref:DNA starvation/stationary phase protection protein n=2 Tax=Streptococcus TaxID=1301 RepID=A0A6I4RIY1_9STRE|nr:MULTISPECIES: Dps family protein [unclassified Streptococcus]MTB64464.1 DNA starvation/stationary phase protection protein [Streptococcus sp. zg-86]MTB90846.1 DNA starvation/stationary phase protection protein [Streptococcus sp. zg-36]MWV56451.1 DNA starvation/stationary phase protection protein [Streptococcus sp. zg-70]QTH47342.1 DNA starvation/stationary phase protection protein [Streptococcus sp. zg-86]